MRRAIEAHGGTLFKTMGDQCCAAFATAPEALSAVLAAQQAVSGVPENSVVRGPYPAGSRPNSLVPDTECEIRTTPERLEFRLRMALHTGTALEREGDFLGPALNRVARLMAAAHGGQILLSRATQELVRDDLPEGASLRDLGTHRLKDLQQPEHLFQLQHPSLPADFSPVRSLEAFAHNLPIQVTSFIGREEAMAEVQRLLTTTHLLTLTGAGGCGKTRLALQVAAELLEQHADGVWLAELASLSDPGLVPQAVASMLGVREEPGRPLTETLIDALLPKKLLLVLDNCEHLLAGTREAGGCAALAAALLRRCPGVRILATSRERLNIAGEITYRVPSLSLPPVERVGRRALSAGMQRSSGSPNATRLTPDALTQYEAVRLFIDRAIASAPAFTVTNANAPAVAEICHRLDGIPLAIELAAARVRVLSAEVIAARLDDRLRLLTGGSRASLPRQQTLRALIDWSHDLLSEPERALLRRLSVFAGGWTLEAAEAVCAGEGVEEWEVLDLLARLVEKSLVLYEERNGEERYRLLEMIREYARERLGASGEAAELTQRHARFFLALVEAAEPELARATPALWLERLEREYDNLRAALAWSGAQEQGELGLRLGGALWRFWEVRGRWAEGRGHLTRLLGLPGAAAPSPARAKALQGAGILARYQGYDAATRAYLEESIAVYQALGDKAGIGWSLLGLGEAGRLRGEYGPARAMFEQGLTIFRELDLKEGVAWSLNELGITARCQGEYGSARAYYEESLAIFRELGDRRGIAWSLSDMANMARDQGDYGAARALHEESLAISRELGDKGMIAWSLRGLGEMTQYQGNYEAARALHEESLAIFRELGFKEGIAWSLHGLGIGSHEQADDEAARALLEEALAIFRELGNKMGITASLLYLGRAAQAQGEYEAARAIFEESLTIYRELGHQCDIADALIHLGDAVHAQEDYEAARALFQQGLAIYRREESKGGISCLLIRLARTARAQGDHEAARAFWEESLAICRELGHKPGIATTLEGLAAVALAHGQPERATRLLGAAAALREAMGTPLPPAERAEHDRSIAAVRTALGEETFAVAWAEGRAMPLEQAVQCALEDPGGRC